MNDGMPDDSRAAQAAFEERLRALGLGSLLDNPPTVEQWQTWLDRYSLPETKP